MQMHLMPPPYGGTLQNLVANVAEAQDLKTQARDWLSWDLTPSQVCDVELLLNGACSPLQGFMGQADYEAVCQTLRLADGTFWPMPLVLDVDEAFAQRLTRYQPLVLRDPEGIILAVLYVTDLWQPAKEVEAAALYHTTDPNHPGVWRLLYQTASWYVGGRLVGVQLPEHDDFRAFRLTPAELRTAFQAHRWTRILTVPAAAPLTRTVQAFTHQMLDKYAAKLLLQPLAGPACAHAVAHYTNVRCQQALLAHYPEDSARLALLPFASRLSSAREILWQSILARNSGCTHVLYDPAQLHPHEQALLNSPAIQAELGLTFVAAPASPAVADHEQFFPEIAAELQRADPPRSQQGLTIFFTGLSGSGKSTIARRLLVKLQELGGRRVTLLDGDLVRKHLSSELGFSKVHRNLNIRRIGFVASEITKHGGIAICAPIAPYDLIRREVRAMIAPLGGFILVHVATSLAICEQRDRKGLYAKARAGLLPEFTGISDPYEDPPDAELQLDTATSTPAEAVQQVLAYLVQAGYLPDSPSFPKYKGLVEIG